jgi:hypothetical protein
LSKQIFFYYRTKSEFYKENDKFYGENIIEKL